MTHCWSSRGRKRNLSKEQIEKSLDWDSSLMKSLTTLGGRKRNKNWSCDQSEIGVNSSLD